jgi:hypothetical protein
MLNRRNLLKSTFAGLFAPLLVRKEEVKEIPKRPKTTDISTNFNMDQTIECGQIQIFENPVVVSRTNETIKPGDMVYSTPQGKITTQQTDIPVGIAIGKSDPKGLCRIQLSYSPSYSYGPPRAKDSRIYYAINRIGVGDPKC